MKFLVKGHGMLAIEGLTPAGLPAMRLVAFHCPNMTVNAHNGVGFLRVQLGDIELRPSFSGGVILPPPILNEDRDQLAKLGSSQG
jgi:hypothetical protein